MTRLVLFISDVTNELSFDSAQDDVGQALRMIPH